MKDEVKIWFSQAEEHFADMILLYKNRRYSLTVYCAHQALEMILKAAIVAFAIKYRQNHTILTVCLKKQN